MAAISDELDASLQAISASAHALDAFYGAVKKHIAVPGEQYAAWKKNRTARPKRIVETVKLGFSVDGTTMQKWSNDLGWLYSLRNGAVHYEEAIKDTELHALGMHMAPEHVAYSVESVGRAVGIVLDVLTICVENPKLDNLPLRGYATAMRQEAVNLVQMRADRTG